MAKTGKGFGFLKLAQIFFAGFLLAFSFQMRTLIYSTPVFDGGNFNVYTSFFIYLADVLLLLSVFSYGIALLTKEVKRKWSFGYKPFTAVLLLLIGALLATIFFAEDQKLSLFTVFRFIEMAVLYFLIVNEVLGRKHIVIFLAVGLVVQSLIAAAQYLRQSSLGLTFWGEPFLSPDHPGVAKLDLNGDKLMRAYGTFPHPNVLGGVLATTMLWIYFALRKNTWVLISACSVLLLALLFSFSRSAFLAFGGAILVYLSVSDRKIGIRNLFLWGSIGLFLIIAFRLEGPMLERLLIDADTAAATERLLYIDISKEMFLQSPLGVGLSHFTLFMQNFTPEKLMPWMVQPVHNVFLLILNEAGVIAFGLFSALLIMLFAGLMKASKLLKGSRKQLALIYIATLVVLVILFLFDHYYWTIYQGQVVLFIYFALASSLLSKSLLPRKKS